MTQLLLEGAALAIREQIADAAAAIGCSVCDLEAEILRQSLMSDDCDQCHVNWLELHAQLDKVLRS